MPHRAGCLLAWTATRQGTQTHALPHHQLRRRPCAGQALRLRGPARRAEREPASRVAVLRARSRATPGLVHRERLRPGARPPVGQLRGGVPEGRHRQDRAQGADQPAQDQVPDGGHQGGGEAAHPAGPPVSCETRRRGQGHRHEQGALGLREALPLRTVPSTGTPEVVQAGDLAGHAVLQRGRRHRRLLRAVGQAAGQGRHPHHYGRVRSLRGRSRVPRRERREPAHSHRARLDRHVRPAAEDAPRHARHARVQGVPGVGRALEHQALLRSEGGAPRARHPGAQPRGPTGADHAVPRALPGGLPGGHAAHDLFTAPPLARRPV